ncbi:MAG: regulatory signaling modulator protein AmpE, partial [Pseudomonadota bacterium]
GLPYLAFSVVVLFLCLGPQDIGEQVDAWADAVDRGDDDLATERGRALLDCDPRPNRTIVDAVFVQGNNRIFSVIFWFICFGPIGAWAMRMADTLRRRSIVRREDLIAGEDEAAVPQAEQLVDATERVHAVMAWIPARLSALSYALAGSFDRAWDAFSKPDSHEPGDLGEENDRLLIDVGCAALTFAVDPDNEQNEEVQHAKAAKRLLVRALVVWVVVVAVITIAGPIV